MRKVYIVTIAASLTLTVYADVIYDEQTYNYEETYNGLSIWGEVGYETADDFEVEGYWTLELVRAWLVYAGEQDIRVDIFGNGADDMPACPPPGDLYYEEVLAESITWTDTGDSLSGYPIYQVDIPIGGFPIESGARYWLGLQSLTGDNSYWLVFWSNQWWEGTCFYDDGWNRVVDTFNVEKDCEFELHGTPDDTGFEAGSVGRIKALYR
jgi:hypothetical protein